MTSLTHATHTDIHLTSIDSDFSTVSRCNREIAYVVNAVVSCRRYQLVTYIHRYSTLAAKHFLYHSQRRHRKGRKAPHSATKDCFLNGGSFLSREKRERVGYLPNKRRGESAKRERKSESE